MLEYNATISHKLPVFAIQFLNTREVWLMCKPIDLQCLSEYLKTGKMEMQQSIVVEDIEPELPKRIISSSHNAREMFNEERKKKYEKTRSAK